MAEPPLTLAGLLRKLRSDAGLTQEELAEAASPHDQAHALAGLGRCSLAAGHVVEAEDSLCQAQEIYRRIGAVEATGVSAELDELRGTSQPAPADPPNPALP